MAIDQPEAVRSVSWSNFRSFRKADLELRRITVLIGSNNSGKSSLHRPLVLLKQTVEIDSALPGLYSRGPLVDCGGFEECSFWGNDSPISFRLRLGRPITLTRQDDAQMEVGELEFRFTSGPPLNLFQLKSVRLNTPKRTRLLERVLRDNGQYDVHGLIKKGNPPNSSFDRALRQAIDEDMPQHFLFGAPQLVSRTFEDFSTAEAASQQDFVLSQYAVKYMALSDAVSEWMVAWLGHLSYLGPSRAAPQRTYRLGSIYEPSRPDGAEVPEVIFRILTGESGLYQGTAKQFSARLQRYLAMLRLSATVTAESRGEDAFSLYVSDRSGTRINLADSAFGFSQVLPLVVRVLLSQPGDTLIVEQPEVHLNPAVQAGLADVLVAGISRGSCAIVETHSEHLLNRLRTLVASRQLDPDDLAIYFVERGPRQSRARRISVTSTGAIDGKWPPGFFGDSLREARELNRAQRGLASRGAK